MGVSGRWGTIGTLSILLGLTFIRDVIEDLRRRATDVKINNRRTFVFSQDHFQCTKWKDVIVGDILEIVKDDIVPADCILLTSSEPLGISYIDTAHLDGESNLKVRQALFGVSYLVTNEDVCDFNCTIELEPQTKDLNEFRAILRHQNKIYQIGLGQFLPRGVTLRNTDWVLGIVIATGYETKQLMNAKISNPTKVSQFDAKVSKIIGALLLGLILLCLICATIHTLDVCRNPALSYTDADDVLCDPSWFLFFSSFLRLLILFHNVVPVSLLATVQIIRLIQSYHIKNDVEIFSEAYNKGATVQNSQLNEMLGQVQYIFSDKTGTITKNKLKFKKCSIGGMVLEPSVDAKGLLSLLKGCQCSRSSSRTCSVDCQQIRDMFQAMVLCHTVIPQKNEKGQEFFVGSPDEKAILQGCADFGISKFVGRDPANNAFISYRGQRFKYSVLYVLEYTSERKMMSTILKTEDGQILMYSKGADSAILSLLKVPPDPMHIIDLEHFAGDGLRTMCYAYKLLEPHFFHMWENKWLQAISQITQRSQKVTEALGAIETELEFLGITGVEDELQDEAKSSIQKLLKANINIWILSGDRQENAVSTAKRAGLIHDHIPLILIPDCDLDEARDIACDHVAKFREENLASKCHALVLVVAGRSIGHCHDCPKLKNHLLELCMCSTTVICYRVDPKQKADLIQMIQKKSGKVTLAIGDGSNDVPMLQTAHIGIGISGIPDEHIQFHGSEAASVADYAIAEFRGLPKLVLSHGAQNSLRVANMVCFFFYKSVTFHLIQLWFLLFSKWSGQPVFDRFTTSLHNLAFTFLPPFALTLMDQYDGGPWSTQSEWNLHSFSSSQRGKHFDTKALLTWGLSSLFHSSIIFLIPWSTSQEIDYFSFEQSIYTLLIFTISGKSLLASNNLNLAGIVFCFLGIAFWALFTSLSGYVCVPNLYCQLFGVLQFNANRTIFWTLALVVPIFALLPDFIAKAFSRHRFERELPSSDFEEDRQTLISLSESLPRIRSRIQLKNLARGFAFSENEPKSVRESECFVAYSRSFNRPKS
ncbi:uncharacterized protein LOC131882984 isoform X2 [Tigriopus californicus]|uniref:uncharacterized protein LOC131882984 isoform X2 n=1 Tax=Tigriopus californicus TaxID=6832 RepID=UPI0027D9FCDB|nr:uncharacterized protein LOC131882984 isoform X2 [Tigriopus californicus]